MELRKDIARQDKSCLSARCCSKQKFVRTPRTLELANQNYRGSIRGVKIMTKYTRKSLRREKKRENTVYVTTVYSNITHNLKNLFVMESPGQLCLKATHPHPHPGQTDAVIKGSIIWLPPVCLGVSLGHQANKGFRQWKRRREMKKRANGKWERSIRRSKQINR